MQHVDLSGLEELDKHFIYVLERIPEMRREFHESMSLAVKGELDSALSSSGINTRGNLSRYQVKHVGSGGGYAAVRPVGKKENAPSGPGGPAAITNYLERGRRIAMPRGSNNPNYRYTPRWKSLRVRGFYFYETAGVAVEAMAIREAEAYAEELADMIGG